MVIMKLKSWNESRCKIKNKHVKLYSNNTDSNTTYTLSWYSWKKFISNEYVMNSWQIIMCKFFLVMHCMNYSSHRPINIE